jgi:hypothetical protein
LSFCNFKVCKGKRWRPRQRSIRRHSASPGTPDFEASEEVLLRALEEASCKYPALIAKSAIIGKVVGVEDQLQGCTIWLSESSMLASSLVPHSIVSVIHGFFYFLFPCLNVSTGI